MVRGVRWYVTGSLILVTLAGCGKGYLHYAERERWRREAEVACIKSGTVRESAAMVRIEPIEGPGVCGAEFPLKVAAFGEGRVFGFRDEPVRPPGSIPNGAAQPRWPIATPPNPPPTVYRAPLAAPRAAPGEPLSINPPGLPPAESAPPTYYPGRFEVRPMPSDPQGAPTYRVAPRGVPPPVDYEIEDDDDRAPRTQPSAPPAYRPPPARPMPALGPPRGPAITGAVEVKPTATLACPIVSALDQWIAGAVQPAALKWFGQPVAEIKQISAYSCRGMNGEVGARISEHAFGNALDIAAFVLADGRRITVKNGWRGTPEEQGFLRDVQAAACEQFTTVLAPGSNRFHYDHIHVDLMRRASGRRICQPGAADGELVAARARGNPTMMARRPAYEAPPTRRYDPPFDKRNDPFAWRGDAVRHGEPATTGSIAAKRRTPADVAAEDLDWIEDPSPRPAIDWTTDRHKPR
jgi:hypothetical protein